MATIPTPLLDRAARRADRADPAAGSWTRPAGCSGERGYLGTTLAGVAAAAEVSVQTVYNVVGGKPVLLKAVYDVTLAGDDEPVPLVRRPDFQAVLAAPDGRTCLRRYARVSRLLGERLLPLVTMLAAQAATGDADLRAFVDTIEGERGTGTRGLAQHVADRFGLRPGLDVPARPTCSGR